MGGLTFKGSKPSKQLNDAQRSSTSAGCERKIKSAHEGRFRYSFESNQWRLYVYCLPFRSAGKLFSSKESVKEKPHMEITRKP